MTLIIDQCPACGGKLRSGYLGEKGYVRWYDRRPGFRTLFNLGRPLLRFNFWGSWLGVTEAKRCPSCSLVIFRSNTGKGG